ncbi:MAG: hypothetical protein II863_05450 [Kiritimatiellae bacterium]|nr:hypothetical protein [Kiritimatiellia bacterium]
MTTRKTLCKRLFAGALAAALATAANAQSVTVNAVTYLDENASIIWRTIKSHETNLAIDWPSGATSAVLTTKIGSAAAQSAVINDTSATSTNVVFTMPTQHADREVVTLSISYRDSSDAELKSKTVRLGLVEGVGNGASIATTLDGSTSQWRRYETHEVVQIPPDATAVTLDGAPVDCDIPGWFDLAAPGAHTLAVETADGTESATVLRAGKGLYIIFK